MQAIEFKEFGSPSQLHLAERPLPQADANIAVVRIEAASVNPSDVKNVAGRMSQTTLPRVPGRDYSGVVVDGPKKWINQEVWGTGGDVGFTRDGSHAEFIQVPVASLVRKPEMISYEQAACVGVTFVTAWCALNYAKLSKGETLAVFGANGGGDKNQATSHAHIFEEVDELNRIQRCKRPTRSPSTLNAVDSYAHGSFGLAVIAAGRTFSRFGIYVRETAVTSR
jgi:D-arabinose 1-dehydrogenase-like Zn-dependent alcohol dehydrogenase